MPRDEIEARARLASASRPPRVLGFSLRSNPKEQIKAYVFDVIRSTLPGITLDKAFEEKDEISLSVKTALAEVMSSYGYMIINTLVTEMTPDSHATRLCTFALVLGKASHTLFSTVRAEERAKRSKVSRVSFYARGGQLGRGLFESLRRSRSSPDFVSCLGAGQGGDERDQLLEATQRGLLRKGGGSAAPAPKFQTPTCRRERTQARAGRDERAREKHHHSAAPI